MRPEVFILPTGLGLCKVLILPAFFFMLKVFLARFLYSYGETNTIVMIDVSTKVMSTH